MSKIVVSPLKIIMHIPEKTENVVMMDLTQPSKILDFSMSQKITLLNSNKPLLNNPSQLLFKPTPWDSKCTRAESSPEKDYSKVVELN